VRKAERAWFLFEGEESEALGINGARPHFLYENVLFLKKWGLAPFIPFIQKQRVFEPYSLSLFFTEKVAYPLYSPFILTERLYKDFSSNKICVDSVL